MKLIINVCYGGFSLSAAAVKRMAELQGKECHFFKTTFGDEKWKGLRVEDCKSMSWSAFSVENPAELLGGFDWFTASQEERIAHNKLYSSLSLDSRPGNRADPILVQVVEELGVAANGRCAELKVIEIPDGIDYEIEEYDGIEHVAEKHRTWGAA